MHRDDLAERLDTLLEAASFADYCPNGLQVEGVEEIDTVVTGVTSCQALIDAARERGAQGVVVHHGILWRASDPPPIRGMLRRRLAALIEADINLYAYHLPLDAHPELGNNAGLARALGAIELEPAFEMAGRTIGVRARFDPPLALDEVRARLAGALAREPIVVAGGPAQVRTVGVVTGGAPKLVAEAARAGLDLFVTGEIDEAAAHVAREEAIHFAAGGHHATERFGVQALADWLRRQLGLAAAYVEIDNPG